MNLLTCFNCQRSFYLAKIQGNKDILIKIIENYKNLKYKYNFRTIYLYLLYNNNTYQTILNKVAIYRLY